MMRRLLIILPYLIITVICVAGVEVFYKMMEERYLQPPAPAQEKTGPLVPGEKGVVSSQPVRKANFQIILQRNIFDAFVDVPQKQEEVKMVDVPIAELEATTLDVILLGTITGNDGDMRAIIYDKSSKKQDLYGIDDPIKGAVIKKIIRGKVVLNYRGKDESLDMSNSDEFKPPITSVSRPAILQRANTPSRTAVPTSPPVRTARPRQLPMRPIRRTPPNRPDE